MAHDYLPLHPDDENSGSTWKPLPATPGGHLRRRSVPDHLCGAVVPWIITAVSWAFFIIYYIHNGHSSSPNPDQLYSPAEAVTEYKILKFNDALFDTPTVYATTNPNKEELDTAWTDLYNYGITKIPYDQAKHLPNATAPIPGEEGQYIIELDVFHQLHCLNMLRQAVRGDNMMMHQKRKAGEKMPMEDDDEHLGHCIEGLRQSLMCSADTTAIVWQWVEDDKELNGGRMKGFPGMQHTCRDFDKIKNWAFERKLDMMPERTFKWGDEVGGGYTGGGGILR